MPTSCTASHRHHNLTPAQPYAFLSHPHKLCLAPLVVPAHRSKGTLACLVGADEATTPVADHFLHSIPNFGTSARALLSRPISSSPVSSAILSDLSCGVASFAHSRRCRVPSYPCLSITQIFFRVGHSRPHSPGKSPHLHQSSQCIKQQSWLLKYAPTATLLLRARLSGTRVPPDLSSNSRYDTIFLCEDAPQSATVTSLTPTPVRPIPLQPLLPAPPVRAKVLRGRRLCRMVQVPQILLPARVPPLSLVRFPSRVPCGVIPSCFRARRSLKAPH